MANRPAAGVGGGGVLKVNTTSSDNTLAFPIPPKPANSNSKDYSYSKPLQAKNVNPNDVGNTQVAGGGSILKSNYTSSENPLSFGGGGPNEYRKTYDNNMGSPREPVQNRESVFPPVEVYRRRDISPSYDSSTSNQQVQPPPPPPQQFQQSQYVPTQPPTGFYSAPVQQEPKFSSGNFDFYPKTAQPYNNNNNATPREDSPRRDIRTDVDIANKQAYKEALDQQVAEKEIMKYNKEREKLRIERDTLRQYPFARRTDPSSLVVQPPSQQNGGGVEPMTMTSSTSYDPSFFTRFTNPLPPIPSSSSGLEQPMRFLNKDNIVEKPNSLSADIPPYDPIKHRNGFHQGFNYDPWGKPGGGAPLVDPKTGKKFTKYSGQVWYDSVGLSPDDRAKMYADRNRPLTLEEQLRDIDVERQRRQYEESVYKSRAGDVATWITEIEKQRNKHRAYAGQLPHTNVTRDKINQEYARRFADMQARKYHNDLGVQLEEKNRSKMLVKLKDDVAGIEHTRQWDTWWGKPGGGAPNENHRRKDIMGSLDSPRGGDMFTSMNSLPVGSTEIGPDGEHMFTIGELRSSHRNLYDYEQKMKL